MMTLRHVQNPIIIETFLFYMIIVKFVHIESFFVFFKSHFLLKNKCSLISVNRASPYIASLASADGQQPPKVGVFISRGRGHC